MLYKFRRSFINFQSFSNLPNMRKRNHPPTFNQWKMFGAEFYFCGCSIGAIRSHQNRISMTAMLYQYFSHPFISKPYLPFSSKSFLCINVTGISLLSCDFTWIWLQVYLDLSNSIENLAHVLFIAFSPLTSNCLNSHRTQFSIGHIIFICGLMSKWRNDGKSKGIRFKILSWKVVS